MCALSYGELSLHAVLELVDEVLAPLRPGDLVVDVGSGVGKLPLLFALLTPANGTGVELLQSRHDVAAAALAHAHETGLMLTTPSRINLASKVRFVHANATAAGAMPRATTHALLSNLCFPRGLTSQLLPLLAAMPRLRTVVSFQPIPPDERVYTRRRFSFPERVLPRVALVPAPPRLVVASWHDSVPLYVYRVERTAAAGPQPEGVFVD